MNSRSNPRRAANRARALNRARAPERDDTLNYSSRPKMVGGDSHYSHGSPASVGSSKGPGPMGAGELPAKGPGAAARSYAQRDPGETPMAPAASSATPRGMTTYRNE
jgi:hypothetical protein